METPEQKIEESHKEYRNIYYKLRDKFDKEYIEEERKRRIENERRFASSLLQIIAHNTYETYRHTSTGELKRSIEELGDKELEMLCEIVDSVVLKDNKCFEFTDKEFPQYAIYHSVSEEVYKAFLK